MNGKLFVTARGGSKLNNSMSNAVSSWMKIRYLLLRRKIMESHVTGNNTAVSV